MTTEDSEEGGETAVLRIVVLNKVKTLVSV
jgi:hypothetical protein